MSELLALLENREAGVVRQRRGRLSFTYTDAWRDAPGAYPLSLSMPLIASEHSHAAIDAFLWGLLPDNEFVLRRWAQRFHVSPRSAFALLAKVGEDCAGAVQFVRPERRETLLDGATGGIDWLTESDVANRLRGLRTDAGSGRADHDTGQFSLAGAQPKTALCFDGQRWGVPHGREPTTHILKPWAGEYDGHAENEHLCLSLARALGLPASRSEVRRFEDVTALVVERYDRVHVATLANAKTALAAAKAAEAAMHAASAGAGATAMASRAAAEAANASAAARTLLAFAKTTSTYRAHQEDICQSLSIHPLLKYQNDGGPGPRQIMDLLRTHVSGAERRVSGAERQRDAGALTAFDEDAATFIDALILNWLIGGTDAHGKNYSILIGGGRLARLAPLYDLASIFAYPNIDPDKAKLAMKIGGEYRLRAVGLSQWRQLAAEIGFDPGVLTNRVRALAGELPDRLADEIRRLSAAGIAHPVIDIMARELSRRARDIAKL